MNTETGSYVLNKALEVNDMRLVTNEEQTDRRINDNFILWFSLNMVITTFAMGSISEPVFNLGYWYSLVAIVTFNIIGAIPVAIYAARGSRFGLRQMLITRYSFGLKGARIIAVINSLTLIGWLIVDVVPGGQMLTSGSSGDLSTGVGILLLFVIIMLVAIFGYKYIHTYERYAWMPMLLLFFVMVFLSAPQLNIPTIQPFNINQFSSFMTFGAAILGFSLGWTPIAADHAVYQPHETSQKAIRWRVFLGIFLSCTFLEGLGSLYAGSGAFSNAAQQGGAAIVAQIFNKYGNLGHVIMIVVAISTIAISVPVLYSASISLQVATNYKNRITLVMIVSIIGFIISYVARDGLNDDILNVTLIISYWVSPWIVILLIEDYFFNNSTYDKSIWNNSLKLPSGSAALVAFSFGMLGVYLGADQEMFQGPIAMLIDPKYGMDLGFEISGFFSAITYFFLRRANVRRKIN